TPEGRIKVLDFGLAKALDCEEVDQDSTVTKPGRIMGTPAYMSPEQVRGLETDERCDIWSFGCVLYEMLTGKVPFEGKTVSDTLASVLDREPDFSALPEATPANIRVLLRRCLEKDPYRRLHDIADAKIEISETLSGSLEMFALPGKVAPVSRLFRRDVILAAFGVFDCRGTYCRSYSCESSLAHSSRTRSCVADADPGATRQATLHRNRPEPISGYLARRYPPGLCWKIGWRRD
ncbi:MAG: serine/threonine-protein kinase, partial [Planctomycetota bacterium]